ncbi:MAG TPA: four helix bundle protein [Bacteroidia bacterium]|nr:four helix bundle protein [Bacteroidia bacterium]
MDEKKFLKLNDITAYKRSFHLSNYIWDVVIGWNNFSRNTVGEQFASAADSISANIAEGFGRYFKKDKIKFYYYSAASVKECFDWNEKSKVRKLLGKKEYEHIFKEISELPKEINQLIHYTNTKLNK